MTSIQTAVCSMCFLTIRVWCTSPKSQTKVSGGKEEHAEPKPAIIVFIGVNHIYLICLDLPHSPCEFKFQFTPFSASSSANPAVSYQFRARFSSGYPLEASTVL